MDGVRLSAFRVNFIFLWFSTAFLTLFFAITLLAVLSISHEANLASSHSYQLYAALPSNQFISTETLVIEDARAKIIEQFLAARNSPLAEVSEAFVKSADNYNLDYRLLPAIAMQESGGGKILPYESYNPFGFGIYGDKVTRFSSWEEGIEKVAKSLKENYIDKGLVTPEQIMAKYTPPSLAKGGPWAIGVSAFMESLK
jgi:hypothetical protein